MEYPSQLIEAAVNEVAKLPGIGRKTALRLVLHLLKEKDEKTFRLAEVLQVMRSGIKYCKSCYNFCDGDFCRICTSDRRDKSLICIVEETRDVMAIENTAQYQGLYHVLGGVISPINGVGPGDLKIDALVARIEANNGIREIILGLSPTMEGDTTAFYIHRRIKDLKVKVSVIARGVPIGGDLEYTDEITLGRSITGRTLFG